MQKLCSTFASRKSCSFVLTSWRPLACDFCALRLMKKVSECERASAERGWPRAIRRRSIWRDLGASAFCVGERRKAAATCGVCKPPLAAQQQPLECSRARKKRRHDRRPQDVGSSLASRGRIFRAQRWAKDSSLRVDQKNCVPPLTATTAAVERSIQTTNGPICIASECGDRSSSIGGHSKRKAKLIDARKIIFTSGSAFDRVRREFGRPVGDDRLVCRWRASRRLCE